MNLRKAFASGTATAALAIGAACFSASAATEPGSSQLTPAVKTKASPHLKFDPHLPEPVLYGSLAALLALSFASRRMRGAWWRGATGAVVVGAIANPSLVIEQHKVNEPVVIVLDDRTPSQDLENRRATTEAAMAKIVKDLAKLGIKPVVLPVGADRGAGATDGTNLFSELDKLSISRDDVGLVIALTDGQVHDVPEPGAWGFKAPLLVAVSGHDGEIDRRIIIESGPETAPVKKIESVVIDKMNAPEEKKPVIKFRVVDDGRVGAVGEHVPVVMTIDGKNPVSLNVPLNESFEVPFTLDHAGVNIIELRTPQLQGELTTRNNDARLSITGQPRTKNVLLISGHPNSSVRLLRSVFKNSDTRLVPYVLTIPPLKEDGTLPSDKAGSAFSFHEAFGKKLSEYDLVVFDQVSNDGFLHPIFAYNINAYVEKGGAFFVVADPSYARSENAIGVSKSLYTTLLGPSLLPRPSGRVLEGEFKPAASESGKRHPVMHDLAGGETSPPQWAPWFRQVEVTDPKGDVLMIGADKKPLLVLERKNEGRVATLLSDQIFVWDKDVKGGGPAADLLGHIADWLLKRPNMDEEALRMMRNAEGKIIIEEQTLASAAKPVTITLPSQKTLTVIPTAAGPGLWRTTVDAEEPGDYKATQGNLTAYQTIGQPNPKEFSATISTLAPTKDFAKNSTGGFATRMNDTSGKLNLPEIRMLDADAKQLSGENSDWIGIRPNASDDLVGDPENMPLPFWLSLSLILSMAAVSAARESHNKYTYWNTWKNLRQKPEMSPNSNGPKV